MAPILQLSLPHELICSIVDQFVKDLTSARLCIKRMKSQVTFVPDATASLSGANRSLRLLFLPKAAQAAPLEVMNRVPIGFNILGNSGVPTDYSENLDTIISPLRRFRRVQDLAVGCKSLKHMVIRLGYDDSISTLVAFPVLMERVDRVGKTWLKSDFDDCFFAGFAMKLESYLKQLKKELRGLDLPNPTCAVRLELRCHSFEKPHWSQDQQSGRWAPIFIATIEREGQVWQCPQISFSPEFELHNTTWVKHQEATTQNHQATATDAKSSQSGTMFSAEP